MVWKWPGEVALTLGRSQELHAAQANSLRLVESKLPRQEAREIGALLAVHHAAVPTVVTPIAEVKVLLAR